MLEIRNRKELNDIIQYEKNLNFSHLGKYQCLLAILKSHPRYINWKYIKLLRIAGYYYYKRNVNIFYSLIYFWKCRKKNKLGRKLGIEMNEKNIGKGVEIYHTFGIVVNGDSEIGENCKFHGNNCIGNNGKNSKCPKIGNNVRFGVGSKVIGDVEIADDVVIAAGSVVVNSILESGVTVAGIPARIVKR